VSDYTLKVYHKESYIKILAYDHLVQVDVNYVVCHAVNCLAVSKQVWVNCDMWIWKQPVKN
jgi:hypothetical protein